MEQLIVREARAAIPFGPFELDRENARLLRDGHSVALTPKSFDVLCYLAERPGRLVKKDELLSAVWPDVVVGDASIKGCVREIRKALGDDAESPRYVETAHRRGYRFIGGGRGPKEEVAVQSKVVASQSKPPAAIVGRQGELDALNESLSRALGGERQVVFVIAPPGGGKSSLVDVFVSGVGDRARVATGHCFEQFGTGEPYLPVWEALSRRPGGGEMDKLAATEPRLGSERLLRELAEAIEGRAAEGPLVLVLEDLHWADYSTLDLISAIARRRGAARLMVVGTYRPGEAPEREQTLRALAKDLLARQSCTELRLSPLDESSVRDYFVRRFPERRLPDEVVGRLFEKTGGHPLFLASVVDDLAEQGGAAGEWA